MQIRTILLTLSLFCSIASTMRGIFSPIWFRTNWISTEKELYDQEHKKIKEANDKLIDSIRGFDTNGIYQAMKEATLSIDYCFYEAVMHNNFDAMKIFLTYGADVNSEITKDTTALEHVLIFHPSNPAVIKLFVKHGADVNRNNFGGWTPLMFAIQHDADFEIIELLVKHGANINHTLELLRITPITLALSYKRLNVACFLLEKGGKTHPILSPLQYCITIAYENGVRYFASKILAKDYKTLEIAYELALHLSQTKETGRQEKRNAIAKYLLEKICEN